MNNEQKLEEARERLTEIAYRDEAKVVSVRAEDLQLVLASLSAPKEEAEEPVGETYYTKGKDAEYFERLPNKEFAWALTCAAQDLNDSDENVSEWMPVGALLANASDRISAAPEAVAMERATHRHKKRGSEYVLTGIGKMQASDWFDLGPPPEDDQDSCVDMREVAIYRSATDPTKIWVRPREEFEDGRFEALAAYRSLRPLSTPKAEAVKPLDLSNVAKHAFLSGVVAARNVPGHKECIGPDLWVDYDPTGEPSYHRILSVIDTSPVALSDNKMKPIGSVGPKGFEAPAAYVRQDENTITIEFETREEVSAAYPVIDRALSASEAEAMEPLGYVRTADLEFLNGRNKGISTQLCTFGGKHMTALYTFPVLTDETVERAAKAIHDGPLGANDEEDFGDNKTSDWCREVARAALLAGGDGE